MGRGMQGGRVIHPEGQPQSDLYSQAWPSLPGQRSSEKPQVSSKWAKCGGLSGLF